MKEIKFDKNINIMIFAQRTMVLLNKYNKLNHNFKNFLVI